MNFKKRVYSCLAILGRARLGHLVHYSGLSARQVRYGLFVLVQLRLAVYSISEQDGVYHYEPNASTAYALVRVGKIMRHVEDRFNVYAKANLSSLLLMGNANLQELGNSNGNLIRQPHKSLVNGYALHGTTAEMIQYNNDGGSRKTIYDLAKENYIFKLQQRDFLPVEDVTGEAERQVRGQHFPAGLKGQKDRMFCQREIRRLKRKWREQGRIVEGLHSQSTVIKRSRPISELPPQKRRKLDTKLPENGLSDADYEPDTEIPVNVCQEKYSRQL